MICFTKMLVKLAWNVWHSEVPYMNLYLSMTCDKLNRIDVGKNVMIVRVLT